MQLDELSKIASEHGVDPTVIEACASPTILLLESPEAASTRSRFGGSPLLPPGMEWPTWDAKDFLLAELTDAKRRASANPELEHWKQEVTTLEARLNEGALALDFICQIDLGEFQTDHLRETLPNRGVLSFFAELRQGAGYIGRANDPPPWKVIWFDDSEALEIRHRPQGARVREAPAKPVVSESAWTVPHICVVEDQQVLSEYENGAFAEFLETLASSGTKYGNQVGGAPSRMQDIREDPREYAAMLDAGFDFYTPPDPALHPTPKARAPRWELILQVAGAYTDAFTLGGVMTFWRQQGPWTPGLQDVQIHFENT
jgi:uncharacterized protein YwqG